MSFPCDDPVSSLLHVGGAAHGQYSRVRSGDFREVKRGGDRYRRRSIDIGGAVQVILVKVSS
jgi:hypothetical protein